MNRRIVVPVYPHRPVTFDQQFWPTATALAVLAGMATGVMLTLLQGPWFWGSLLLLPTGTAAILYLFYKMDDHRFRRSLQLAMVSSMVFHLGLILVATGWTVFRPADKKSEQLAKTMVPRVIEVTDRRARFVWEQPNRAEVPQPIVELVKQSRPVSELTPQPVVVAQNVPSTDPQSVPRERLTETTPRHDQSLSELRRQLDNQHFRSQLTQPRPHLTHANSASNSPRSSSENLAQESLAQSTSVPNPELKASPPDTVDLERQSLAEMAALERAKPVAESTKIQIQLADSNPPRATAEQVTVAAAAPSAPSPTLRKSSRPSLPPLATPKVSLAANESQLAEPSSVPKESGISPAPSSLTRRMIQDSQLSRSVVDWEPPQTNPLSEPLQSAARHSDPSNFAAATSDLSPITQPQRSVPVVAALTSPIQIENPAPTPTSARELAELNPSPQSLQKSTEGLAGLERGPNLDSEPGGNISPATAPSDSATRATSQAISDSLRQLVNSQAVVVRQATGAATLPQTILLAESEQPAQRQGSKQPAQQTLRSSAAEITSSARNRQSQTALEKGSAQLDLGAIKRATEVDATERRSGGGQPEIGELNPRATPRGISNLAAVPSIVAATSATVAAPDPLPSPRAISEIQPNATSNRLSKIGPQAQPALERNRAIEVGQASDAEWANSALENLPRSAEAASSPANPLSHSKVSPGTQASDVSAAPILKGKIGLGNHQQATGISQQHADNPRQPLAETTSSMQRLSTVLQPESQLGKNPHSPVPLSRANSRLAEASAIRASQEPALSEIGKVGNQLGEVDHRQKNLTGKTGAGLDSRALQPTTRQLAGIGQVATLDPDGTDSQADTAAMMNELGEVKLQRTDVSYQDQGAYLEINATEGAAGMAHRKDDALGIRERPSSRDSPLLDPLVRSRFQRPNFGGKPAISPDAVFAKKPFRQRAPTSLAGSAEPATEAAIQLGLEFLLRQQTSQGNWTLGGLDRDHPQSANQLNSDMAATGLAILAFQGAGYNHREYQYATVIQRGLQWMLENQAENGGLYLSRDKKSDQSCRFYSHAIATLALTEAYGMTQDSRLQQPAQRAIDYILATQDPRRGGWRYFEEPLLRSTDTSVTGWMMMALHSGRLVGLQVDSQAFHRIDDWLQQAVDANNPALFRYNPFAVDSQGVSRQPGRQASATMTAVGLLMKIYSGWEPDHPVLKKGADWLQNSHPPADGTIHQRDTYYWYYATQVMKYVDGANWDRWNQQLHPMLIRSQIKTGSMAGSWHPYNPIPDRWGSFGGRLYVTTMNLLSLEVRYRMLPLYQQINPQPSDSGNR